MELVCFGSTPVHLKLEHLQHTGSFKFRGATNKIAVLTPEQAAAGVVAASNGNHGLGVAAAEPLYAQRTDAATNTVVVGPRASLARVAFTATPRCSPPAPLPAKR